MVLSLDGFSFASLFGQKPGGSALLKALRTNHRVLFFFAFVNVVTHGSSSRSFQLKMLSAFNCNEKVLKLALLSETFLL